MIVYEFYLKDVFKAQAFDVLCNSFYGLGNVMRASDHVDGTCVFAVSRNPQTHWVQLLVDDNTPTAKLTAIEGKIRGLCDTTFTKYSRSDQPLIAPFEREREVIGI